MNWLKKSIARINKKSKKVNLENSLKVSEQTRERDIESIHETWKILKKAKIKNYDKFYNVSLFSAIVYHDICILTDSYFSSKSNSSKNLYARLLGMTIIEYLDDINGMIGKDLRLELINNNLPEVEKEILIVNKNFSNLKRKHNSRLRDIRNKSTAHKVKNADELINFTRDNFFEDVYELSLEVSSINKEFIQISTKVVNIIIHRVREN